MEKILNFCTKLWFYVSCLHRYELSAVPYVIYCQMSTSSRSLLGRLFLASIFELLHTGKLHNRTHYTRVKVLSESLQKETMHLEDFKYTQRVFHTHVNGQ